MSQTEHETVPEHETVRHNRLFVVRHGETEWSKAGRHTSRTDLPLTEQGEAAAVAAGAKLGELTVSAVFVSPRLRARRTAELCGFGDRSEIEPDLVEWDYGDDEGRTTSEIRVDRPGWTIWRDGPLNGETSAQVSARVDRVIQRVAGADGDVLAFAHGHVLDVLAARWVGLGGDQGAIFNLDPTTLSILSWHHDDRVIDRWNAPLIE